MTKPVLVVKVGTSTLLDREEAPSGAFEYVAFSIMALSTEYDIVLVTSGAIGFGVTQLRLGERPTGLSELQALSMIGQVGLLRRWRESFDGVTIGQVLVTTRDLEQRATTNLFRESVQAVWRYGAVPIVNENDAISTEEISFGDNDRLAAEVARVLGAERLVLLTDQDGIQAEFGTDAQRRLDTVSIDEIDVHIHPTKSVLGKGGASSKVAAARVALEAGVDVFVAHAGNERALEHALSGVAGTKIVQ